MKKRSPTSAVAFCAALVSVAVFVMAGCSGSGPASSGSPSADTVRVSLAQGTRIPGGALPQIAQAPGGGNGGPSDRGPIDHAWITVVKIALIPESMVPGGESTAPDPEGEPSVEDSGMEDRGFVSAAVPPTEIDLMNLPPAQFAMFLNDIKNIPAGKYVKIRLYYADPKVHFEGEPDNTTVHATANYHLDIHFVGGGLVIPVRTNPDQGVFVHDVTITFVEGGLKITVNPNKILMRPQVFATVSAVQMGITGVADNVVPGSFDIATADGRSFHAVYDDATDWFFREPTRWVRVFGVIGPEALRDTAIVDVLGYFDGGLVLVADDILITFPATRQGTVATGWQADNTFTLAIPPDNVVFVPDRLNAYYDNNAPPFLVLTDNAVVPGATVTARGYAVPGRIEAYWISIGP